MAAKTIRNFDDKRKQGPASTRAAQHGRSTEVDARDILRTALSTEASRGVSLVDAIRARVAPLGGIELELPAHEPIRVPPSLDT